MSALTWTRTPPSSPGWWWTRREGDTDEIVVLVWQWNETDDDLKFDGDGYVGKRVQQCTDREWAGPIAPPREG